MYSICISSATCLSSTRKYLEGLSSNKSTSHGVQVIGILLISVIAAYTSKANMCSSMSRSKNLSVKALNFNPVSYNIFFYFRCLYIQQPTNSSQLSPRFAELGPAQPQLVINIMCLCHNSNVT